MSEKRSYRCSGFLIELERANHKAQKNVWCCAKKGVVLREKIFVLFGMHLKRKPETKRKESISQKGRGAPKHAAAGSRYRRLSVLPALDANKSQASLPLPEYSRMMLPSTPC